MTPRVKTPAEGLPIVAGGSVLRPLKAAEVVAREIVRSIRSRRLQPGDPLPGEANMLEQYGVSRESLREGLRLLEVQGMITLRRGPGGGPRVGTIDPANLGRMQALFFDLAGAGYDELFAAWVFAEAHLARLAAAHTDVAARECAMAPYLSGEAEQVAREDLEVFVAGHGSFHDAVARLSSNRVLQLTFRSYGLVVAHHLATVGDVRSLHNELVEDHLDIAQAIVDGDEDSSAELMASHLKSVIDANRIHLGALLDGPVEWL